MTEGTEEHQGRCSPSPVLLAMAGRWDEQTWLNRHMEIGEHWAYRARPKELGGAVRQVEIVRVGGPGRSGWLHVRFLEGDAAGLQEWVRPGSLVARGRTSRRSARTTRRSWRWPKSSRHVRGSAEFEAARMILGFVRPKSKLRLRRRRADAGILELSRLDETAPGLSAWTPRSFAATHGAREPRAACVWPGGRSLSASPVTWPAVSPTRSFRRWTAGSRPSIRSVPSPPGTPTAVRDDRKLDAEAAVLRTVREWCGQDKAERYDELVALRAEVIRLGELVEKAVKALRDRGHGVIASTIERDLGVHISSLDPDVRR